MSMLTLIQAPFCRAAWLRRRRTEWLHSSGRREGGGVASSCRLLHVLEAAFWVAGSVLLAGASAAMISGEVARKHAIADFTQARTALAAAVVSDPDWQAPARDAEWMLPRAVAAADAGSADAVADPIALLLIPRVAFEVPVFADISERNLNRGAGWIEGTAAPGEFGNIGIAGHRDRYFRVLKDVVVGDLVELDSLSQRHLYRVTAISIVKPEDNSALRPTDDAVITLVTCYPFYYVGHAPKRYVVRAVEFSETAETGTWSAPTVR